MDTNTNRDEMEKELETLKERLENIEKILKDYGKSTELYKRAELLLTPTKSRIATIERDLGVNRIVQGQLSRQKNPFRNQALDDEEDIEL